MKHLKLFCVIFALCLSKFALSLENNSSIFNNSKLALTSESDGLISENLEYHWLQCPYSTANVYTLVLLNETECFDNWIDNCDYSRLGVRRINKENCYLK